MENSVRWYAYVLRREVGHILGRSLQLKLEGQRKKICLKMAYKNEVYEKKMKLGFSKEDEL